MNGAKRRTPQLAAVLLGAMLASGAGTALAQEAPGCKEAMDKVWATELQIYQTRAKGSMQVIIDNQSPYTAGWPHMSQALNSDAVVRPFTEIRGPNSLKGNQERVEMTRLDMACDGRTIVNMYKTHRTQMSDGRPADDYFEITHIWSLEDGAWHLLAARPQPVHSPEK